MEHVEGVKKGRGRFKFAKSQILLVMVKKVHTKSAILLFADAQVYCSLFPHIICAGVMSNEKFNRVISYKSIASSLKSGVY